MYRLTVSQTINQRASKVFSLEGIKARVVGSTAPLIFTSVRPSTSKKQP
jgi:hypothetical protein